MNKGTRNSLVIALINDILEDKSEEYIMNTEEEDDFESACRQAIVKINSFNERVQRSKFRFVFIIFPYY